MCLSNRVAQWGGVAFMFGNLLFLVNKLNEMSRLFLFRSMPDVISGQDRVLIVIGQVALIAGYVAYFWLYVGRVGRFGKNALRLFCGGGILLAVGHVSFMPILTFDLFILVLIGLAVMLIGLIGFGIASLRQPILGRWRGCLWQPDSWGLLAFFSLVARR